MLDARLIHAVHAAHANGAVFQTSTLEALLHGAYLGDVTVAELGRRGDLGLGTFDALDGELIAVDGVVYVRLRSVPAQRPPWRTLDQVLAEQRITDAEDVDGTIVGFRFLRVRQGSTWPASTCTSISADRRFGGHLLSCRTRAALAALDFDAGLDLELPPGVALPSDGADLGGLARLERDDG